MSELIDEEVEEKVGKPDFKVRLSEKYAIDTDKYNITLLERYEKREGKGKFAELSGEYGWKGVGYFQSIERLAEWLAKNEMLSAEGVTELADFGEVIKKLTAELVETLKEKVEVKME